MKIRIIGDAVDIKAGLELVLPVPFLLRKKKIGNALPTPSASIGEQIVISTGPFWSNEIGKVAQRSEVKAILHESGSGLEQFTAFEVVLILKVADITGLHVGRRRGNRIEG